MKVLSITMVLFFVVVFSILPLCYGEVIYTKDGEIIEAKIIEKTKDTIWYEVEKGDIIEEIGIDISEVDKVLNDDGSVSKYSPN